MKYSILQYKINNFYFQEENHKIGKTIVIILIYCNLINILEI